MLSIISKISTFCGKLGAWLFFAIGCIIMYQVVARYVFLKPTIWVEEMSRFLQIWATYLAAAYVLKNRQLIAIHVIRERMPAISRRISEAVSLVIIGIFSLVAAWYGSGIVIDSIRIGRASASMLGVPLWMTEIAIPIGFGLLFLQVLAELVATVTGRQESISDGNEQ